MEGQGQQQDLVTILQSLAPLGANMGTAEELESQLSDSRVLGLNFLPSPFCKILLQGAHSVLARGRGGEGEGGRVGGGVGGHPDAAFHSCSQGRRSGSGRIQAALGSRRNPLPPGGDLDAAVKGNLTSAAPQEMQTGQVSRGPRPPISVTGATNQLFHRGSPSRPLFLSIQPTVVPPG